MRDGECPKCGSNDVYMREKNGGNQINAIPLGGFWSRRQFPIDNYVCTNCGFVESYLSDANALRQIAKEWRHVRGGKPKRDAG